MFKKNAAVTGFAFAMVNKSDGSAITTGMVSGYYLLDGGTQGSIADTPTHEGNGQWSVDLTADEMNGDVVGLLFTHTDGIPVHFTIRTDTKIVSELQDLTAANVQTECDAALASYDGPTKAEMDTAHGLLATETKQDIIDTNVDAILLDTGTDGVAVASHTTAAKAEIQAEAEDALAAYDPPTKAEMDAGLAGLNDLSAAEVQTEAEDALETYDLDHFIQVTAGSEEPTDGSYLDQVMHKATGQTFNATTDSLEAIRDVLSSSDITVVAAVDGDDITVVPYTTWEFTIDGLAALSDALANGVFFTVKRRRTHTDAQAILQVQEGVGLKYIDSGAAGDASKATLTVAASEDEITVHVNASVTGLIEMRDLFWDIKKLITADEDADQVATGDFHIADEAVTRELDVS